MYHIVCAHPTVKPPTSAKTKDRARVGLKERKKQKLVCKRATFNVIRQVKDFFSEYS